jgi:hypothetical protein
MDRFDIPEDVKIILDKGIEIGLLDGADIIAFGIKFGCDWDGVVQEILEFAYSNIHVNNDHNHIASLSDNYFANKG